MTALFQLVDNSEIFHITPNKISPLSRFKLKHLNQQQHRKRGVFETALNLQLNKRLKNISVFLTQVLTPYLKFSN